MTDCFCCCYVISVSGCGDICAHIRHTKSFYGLSSLFTLICTEETIDLWSNRNCSGVNLEAPSVSIWNVPVFCKLCQCVTLIYIHIWWSQLTRSNTRCCMFVWKYKMSWLFFTGVDSKYVAVKINVRFKVVSFSLSIMYNSWNDMIWHANRSACK